jgi:DNA (cytosine-5)-methyltransferase 1
MGRKKAARVAYDSSCEKRLRSQRGPAQIVCGDLNELSPYARCSRNREIAAAREEQRRRPIAVDLFSGAGGLSLGFEQAGFDIVLAVECDALHAAAHAYNFPRCAILNCDVAKLRYDVLFHAIKQGLAKHGRDPKDWNGEVDVVIGGPPCQGFSVIGKRDAQEARNKLVYAFASVVQVLQPRYFAMENVPGMRVGEQGKTLRRLVAKFAKMNYFIVGDGPHVINAADFGVPQDRERLFIVGARDDVRLPNVVQAIESRISVRDAIADLPELDNYPELEVSDEVKLDEVDICRQEFLASPYARKMIGIDIDLHDFSVPRKYDPTILSCSLRTRHSAAVQKRFARTPQDGLETISRFHKLPLDGRANTIRAGTGPDHGSHTSARPIHPTLPRVITAREAARLQSFPDWFRFNRTRWHAFRQIGNAVPPLLARAIAETIVAAIGIRPRRPTEAIPLGDVALLSLGPKSAASYFMREPAKSLSGGGRNTKFSAQEAS